jgi:hypothetical protein
MYTLYYKDKNLLKSFNGTIRYKSGSAILTLILVLFPFLIVFTAFTMSGIVDFTPIRLAVPVFILFYLRFLILTRRKFICNGDTVHYIGRDCVARTYKIDDIAFLYLLSNSGEGNPDLYVIEFNDGNSVAIAPENILFTGCYGSGIAYFEMLLKQANTISTETISDSTAQHLIKRYLVCY